MRKFIIGLLVGIVLGGSLVYAGGRLTLESANGTELGTSDNPLIVKTN